MIGQELGGRYEILERIGGGGMALVYKGHDLLLNRKVAIKVLRQQFVNDDEFIRRFRREAQAAASLSHPNVVSIYDVGQQDEVHYIVMEYIEGQTLNDLIKDKAPLQVEEAIHITSQICDALDHAHANQIIHRDIKPHNILIGKNGRVKVTDFGIARATTSSTITQTGSVVGSVHYFSPEHAKGTMAGAKSDLYSLGIVLYQMLTARLPFLGESPISVALKHLQEEVEDPRKVNPLIPQSVENIILKAMRKNPDERYQSANEMLQDLETCLDSDRRNEPKLIFFEAIHEDDAEATRVIPAIRTEQIKGASATPNSLPTEASKSKPWVKPVLWIGILLVTFISLWFFVQYVFAKLDPNEVMVPNLEGKPISEAKLLLDGVKLKYQVNFEFNDKVDKDIVLKQDKKDMNVKEGGLIVLTISKGISMLTMEDFKGKPIKDVSNALVANGIKREQIKTDYRPFKDEPKDAIVQQEPKAGEIYDPTKVVITFIVSKGRERVQMPDLIGLTEKEAKARLVVSGLDIKDENIQTQPSFAQPKGRVFKQWPYEPKDDVDAGAEDIHILISSGPPQDAGPYTGTFSLPPAKDGQVSTWRIVTTDVQAESKEYLTFSSSKTEVKLVNVTVTKDKNATIQFFRDNVLFDTKIVTYNDYLNQKNIPTPQPSNSTSGPNTSPSTSVKPVVSPSPSATPRR